MGLRQVAHMLFAGFDSALYLAEGRVQGRIPGDRRPPLVDSKELEHRCRVLYAGVPSFFGGRACSNFLASTAFYPGN